MKAAVSPELLLIHASHTQVWTGCTKRHARQVCSVPRAASSTITPKIWSAWKVERADAEGEGERELCERPCVGNQAVILILNDKVGPDVWIRHWPKN